VRVENKSFTKPLTSIRYQETSMNIQAKNMKFLSSMKGKTKIYTRRIKNEILSEVIWNK